MDMTFDDVVRLCAEVSRFSHKANLRWKGLPIVAWEFANVGDFARTREMILRAIQPHMLMNEQSWQRAMGDTLELDCHGVTFRLVCKQKTMTPHGPYGAAEIK